MNFIQLKYEMKMILDNEENELENIKIFDKQRSYKIGVHNVIQLKNNLIVKGLIPLEKIFD